jgi:serine phosphatase RsbU (regulator of sigma subunit)
MFHRSVRPSVLTAVLLIVVVPVFIIGGSLVRGLVNDSFRAQAQLHATQLDVAAVLKAQLDEETGIRGYAATGQRVFLEPYRKGRAEFATSEAALEHDVQGTTLDPGGPAALHRINAEWLTDVATPLLRNVRDTTPIQRQGKRLVDAFRVKVAQIDGTAAARQTQLDVSTRDSIDRINLLIAIVALAVVAFALAFGVVQARLSRRLDDESRTAAELRVAYETEKRVADTLQDAFLQRSLPTTPSVSFSATYVPATEEAKVGGDWYDGIELGRGRVMFVIGDVAGHGLEAAVAMNRTRQALVSAAVVDPDPAALLSRVNRELIGERARMVTAVCGFADSENYVFAYATAGHPPPVLLEPDRPPRLLHFGGLPLGVIDSSIYRTYTVQTVPGAMLVLYTDGAVEHSRDVIAGERELLAAVASVANVEIEHAATAIHERIFAGRPVGDDVAILTVTFAGPESSARDGADHGADHGAIVAEGARGSTSIGGTIVSLAARLRRRAPAERPRRIAS